MASLRFATVRDLFDAFSTVKDDVSAEPNDEPSVTFLRSLVEKGDWAKAISFCAYLLPRREAVWWGCQTLRAIQQANPAGAAALNVAEAWVHAPEESLRRQALDLASRSDPAQPTTWMALAAGWSGGSIAPPEMRSVPPAPYQTARAIRAGLLIAMAATPNDEILKVLPRCVENAIELVVSRSA